MTRPEKSRRGVYYDLSASPYQFKTRYGDSFKFRSAKKLEIFQRDMPKEVEKVGALVERHNLREFLPPEIIALIERSMTRALYKKIEG